MSSTTDRYREFEMLIRAWLECSPDKRQSPEALAERIAVIARRLQAEAEEAQAEQESAKAK